MLVLTRKLNEELVIGDQGITIKVVAVQGGRVRLGVQAPRDVRVERGEILQVPVSVSDQACTAAVRS